MTVSAPRACCASTASRTGSSGWTRSTKRTRLPSAEIGFTLARVLMQDFTGVPCIVDLAAMREAMAGLGGDPAMINPRRPAELVIDHSVIADYFGRPSALERNIGLKYRRNRERYQFLRWGQQAFGGLRVVPPGTGICHQVNIEHLARVVFAEDGAAFPDTLVGTDSHTTMVGGLGVLGLAVCVPKTYATWADVLHLAVGSVPRLVPGQVGGADLAEGATILGLWA